MYESHKNTELTKNASFNPFTITGGGGGIFKWKLVTMGKKGGHMKDSLRTRRPTRASVRASTDTGVPIALSADHRRFRTPDLSH